MSMKGHACSICLEDESEDVSSMVTLSKCGHTFHRDCLKQLHNDLCPMCRCELSEGDLSEEAMNGIKKRKRDNMEQEEERELINLQTLEFMPMREIAGLPGSRVFYAILTALFTFEREEVLMSFEKSRKVDAVMIKLRNWRATGPSASFHTQKTGAAQ